jgi:ABC-type multidrug transport system ATPase subunit
MTMADLLHEQAHAASAGGAHPPLLRIADVSRRYGANAWGLREVSLELAPGVLGLLGPNGAGKSTLMRILATADRPTSGSVHWRDVDIAQRPDPLRSELGYLPQTFGVYPHLNAIEFLEYIAALKGLTARSARSRIADLLTMLNLTDAARRPIGGYSGGMRQRIGIAQALLNDPALLIVDEPTVGLDPEERVRFRNLLSDLAGERLVIFSTHIVSDVAAIATGIALIAQGRLLVHATPEALLQQAAGQTWEWIVPAEQVAAVRQHCRVSGAQRTGAGVRLRIVAPVAPDPAAVAVPPTLEDAYLLALQDQGAEAQL